MEIMSSSSLLKGSKILLALVFLAGCQSLRTREDVRRSAPPTPQRPSTGQQPTQPGTPHAPVPRERDEEMPVVEAPPPPPSIPTMPKIGIILGGGGARTYAHIGFLHELSKLKVPVTAIGGIEFGSPMAALYANKELANDVEWQMFKLKEEDIVKKSLLGATNKNNDVTVLKDFIQTSFARVSPEDFRVPFACPSYHFPRNQTYLMNKGSIEQVLYACMAYPPFFKAYNNQVAGVREVTALANHLRQRGANFIVFVNVLPLPAKRNLYGDISSTDNVLWSEIAGLYNKPLAGIDAVVSLDAGDYGIMDFDKRREIMNRGSGSAAKSLKNLTRKWGF
ncbi:hypothetical protein D3C87_111550 [compost metagenome]